MNEFDTYSPADVISANLIENDKRRQTLDEQEFSHLRELAYEISATAKLPDLLQSLPDHRLTLPEEKSARQSPRRALILAAEIARMTSASGKQPLPIGLFFPESEPLPSSGMNRIVYPKNSYTNEAFLRLSPLLSEARAVYTHSYLAACEEVYRGTYDYCILPIENSAEGHLTSFARLLEKYELKIVASCDILGNGSARCTRFALLRRNLLPVIEVPNAEQILEFSLPQEQFPGAGDILYAAERTRLHLLRINTLPRTGNDGGNDTHFAFLTTGGDIRTFLLYLAMEVPHYTPIGFYPNLIQKGNN